ncbi:hypothetical protein FNJ59_14970, partial [Bacteroides pyogenes]|uniref:hypothetical protein n=1 Tax=Bacteroides pyogenes TaxID=310300 RepID=UPI0011E3BBC9
MKRKVRVTEALIVAFFIAGNLGYAQESSAKDSNTTEDGIAIGQLIEVTLKDGVVTALKASNTSEKKYSFAEKGTAKAELAKKFDAGFRITNYKNKWNKDYETMIGAQHTNGDAKDRYANIKEEGCK